eukprot:s198_g1.t2
MASGAHASLVLGHRPGKNRRRAAVPPPRLFGSKLEQPRPRQLANLVPQCLLHTKLPRSVWRLGGAKLWDDLEVERGNLWAQALSPCSKILSQEDNIRLTMLIQYCLWELAIAGLERLRFRRVDEALVTKLTRCILEINTFSLSVPVTGEEPRIVAVPKTSQPPPVEKQAKFKRVLAEKLRCRLTCLFLRLAYSGVLCFLPRVLSFLLASLAVLAALRPTGLGWLEGRLPLQDSRRRPSRLARQAEKDIVVSRQVPLIPRPKKGPKPIVELPYYQQPHVPDGADRRPGPIRGLVFRQSIPDTLETGVDDSKRGGLKGRYAMEVKEHLAARQWLVRHGIRENITVFWDHDSFAIPEVYELRPLEALNRYCRWIAGLLGATVTRVETVEYTRFDNPPRMSYLQGQQNLYNSLRQFGGVVHRVWPPVTDGVDVILFERFRHHLDIMANGGPRSILCLMAQEKGYQAMIEAAQSEGVTVVRVGRNGEMAYYPGGHDFSVPIFWDRWRFAQKEIFDTQLNPFRAKSDFAPEHGPKKWHEGPVQLEYFDPSEELDRRVFHSFINKKDFMRNGSIVTGTYVKPGIRLNDTLVQAIDRASEVSETKLLKQPGKGTFYFNEDLEALVQQEPEVAAAVRADLESLGKLDPEDYATILWNFESHWLTPAGPPMQEVLARVVRWAEGFTKVPAKRVEVAKFVEPWVRIGQQALDWSSWQS